MRILVLGGGWFLGKALVAEALLAGHDVTVFNRGKTSGPDPEGVTAIHGDRNKDVDLATLATAGPFDAVIDTSGQVPRSVLASARALEAAGRYVFISSVSAYAGWPMQPLTEDSPVLQCPSDAGEDAGYNGPEGYPTTYGFCKAGCENAVREVFDVRATILRPGVILGPWEYVGRGRWWLRRIAAGGRVLAPGRPDQPIQPIDVRDATAFALHTVTAGIGGAFNLTAPGDAATFGSFLAACKKATGSSAELVWVADRVLTEHQVKQWTELPLWRTTPGAWRVSADKASAAGLRCRPLEQTVADTWSWLESGAAAIEHERAGELGIDPAKEAAILAANPRST